MTWEINLVLMLRVLINDSNIPLKNTDLYLQRVLVTAGIFVNGQIELPQNYIYDIDAVTITPDPIVVGDSISESLMPLKAACIINQGDFQKAIGQGIKVRDGDSAIDTSVGFRGFRDILELGPCKSYDRLLWDIQRVNADGYATALNTVVGAFRDPNSTRPDLDTISFYFDNFASALHSSRNNGRSL